MEYTRKLNSQRKTLIEKDDTIDNPKKTIHEIVHDIIGRIFHKTQKRLKEADKKLETPFREDKQKKEIRN